MVIPFRGENKRLSDKLIKECEKTEDEMCKMGDYEKNFTYSDLIKFAGFCRNNRIKLHDAYAKWIKNNKYGHTAT